MRINGRSLREIQQKERKKRKRRLIAFVLLTAFVMYRFIFALILINSNIDVTAHRGNTSVAPENTIASVLEAIAIDSDFVEIDVQLTKDGQVILLHDATFKRVAGVSKRPSEMTYEEVQELNVGLYKTDTFEFKAPLLEDVLDVCKFSSINLNIELKDYGKNRELPIRVVDIIKEYYFCDRCVITSYSQNLLRIVKALCPEIKVGLITKSSSLATYINCQFVDIYSVNYIALSPSIVMYAHFKNKEIYCWTPNNKVAIETAIRAGADNIITDNVTLTRFLIVSLK